MLIDTDDTTGYDAHTARFCRTAMLALQAAGLPFLVGGAFALRRFIGIARNTKDFDLFVRPADRDRCLAIFAELGCHTSIAFEHWLGKARCGDIHMDVIYRSGNGISEVDDSWFVYARSEEIFGVPVKLCPPEETIWTKAFIQERERFDGADVAHMLLAGGRTFDWRRMLDLFGEHWRVLLSHLVLFGFIYPSERDQIPAWVMEDLTERLLTETHTPPPVTRVCNGTLLSRVQYRYDTDAWSYADARIQPRGTLTRGEAARWTEAGLEGDEG